MLTAVLDTNVVVSATLIRGGNEDQILRAWAADQYLLALSRPILREMRRVLFYEKIRSRRWIPDDELERLLERFAKVSLMVPGKRRVRVCRDPKDDKFLAVALEGNAQYVVSGDADLTALQAYRGVKIVTPSQFLDILRATHF